MTSVSDDELLARFPDSWIDYDNRELYRGWLEHRLVLTRCADCGHWQLPRPICPACWSTDVVPAAVSGDGVVHLLVKLHQGPPAPDVDYTRGPLPVVAVELAEQEGLRYTAALVDCPPEQARIGMAVELDWRERYGAPYPVFRPQASVTA